MRGGRRGLVASVIPDNRDHLMGDDQVLDDMLAGTSDPVRWAFLAGVRLLGARRASLLLLDGSELQIVASVGIDPAIAPGVRVQLGQGVAGVAAERNATLFGQTDSARYISVPISTPRGVAGVLNLTNREGSEDFDDRDIKRARALASHIGYLLTLEAVGAVDPVSSLPNHYAFEEALEREVARSHRTATGFALVLLELPGLVGARDQAGEDLTDTAVRRIATELRKDTRPYDVVARFRPDAFALLFPGVVDQEEALIRRGVADVQRSLDSVDIDIPIRVACVHCPADGVNAHDVLQHAQERLRDVTGRTA